MLKKTLSVVLALVMALSVLALVPATAGAATIYTYGDYSYVINSDRTVTVHGYNGCDADVTVPAKLNGLQVSAIGENAFYNNTDIESVTLPEGVLEIGRAAFYFCTDLTQVDLPESLETIGSLSFVGTGIYSIDVPANTNNISYSAFWLCDDLTSINVASANTVYASKSGVLYSKDIKTLYAVPGGLNAVNIADTTTELGMYCCYGNTNLSVVNIPESVTEIGEGAFIRCSKLTSVTIPSGVKEILAFVFEECDSLVSVNIPNGVVGIYSEAFANCDSLQEVVIPASVRIIEADVFANSPSVCIYAQDGSYAEQFAIDNLIKHEVSVPTLLAPSVTVYELSYTSALVGWNEIDGANGYKVYRKQGTGSFECVATTTDVNYLDTSCEPNELYYYTVRAYVNESDTSTYSSYNKDGVEFSTVMEKTVITYYKADDYNKITIGWRAALRDISGYRVYRRDVNGAFEPIAEVSADTTYFSDTTVLSGRRYYYTVKAVLDVNGTEYFSDFSPVGILAVTYPKAPKLISTKALSSGIQLNFEKVNGAAGYRVYRRESTSSKWTAIGTYNKYTTTVVDKTAQKGVNYYYTVKAYTVVDGNKVFGVYNVAGISGRR